MSEKAKLEQIYPGSKRENWHEDFGSIVDIKRVLVPDQEAYEGDHSVMIEREDRCYVFIAGALESNNLWLGRMRKPLDFCVKIPDSAWVLHTENVNKIEVNKSESEVIFSLGEVTWMKDWDSTGEELSLDKAQLIVNGKGRIRLMSKALESVAEF